ncbi:MAG: cell division protein ZapA [Roseovarius sp.]|nr:cell division protein ZapA [Roseovarius sp.]MCY4315507.1 cell division protein ZapA [Roseovarius sp.]
MPEVEIKIAGRSYKVDCQEGDETNLLNAAGIIEDELHQFSEVIHMLSEIRILLMASLILADKTTELRCKISDLEKRISSKDIEMEQMRIDLKAAEDKALSPAIPNEVLDGMVSVATRIEEIERKVTDDHSKEVQTI